MVSSWAIVINALLLASFWLALYGDRSTPEAVVVCKPPCKDGEVICTWDSGGNGFNGSTDCQRKCGSPVGDGEACKLTVNKTCYWAWTKEAGWACFAGPVPCDSDGSVFLSAYVPCVDLNRDYGGCGNCSNCCSHACHCKDLMEDKSECLCGKKDSWFH